MAKGKIKLLNSPWENLTIERNNALLELKPIELGRGDGSYLGLLPSADITLQLLEEWTAKEALPKFTPMTNADLAKLTPELQEAYKKQEEAYMVSKDFRHTMFIGKVCDAFNVTLKDLWRTIAEEYGDYPEKTPAKLLQGTNLTPEKKVALLEAFKSEVDDWLSGVKVERQRDASYYRRQAKLQADAMVKLVKSFGKKLSECTADQQMQVKALMLEKDRLNKLADDKEREEVASVEAELNAIEALLKS